MSTELVKIRILQGVEFTDESAAASYAALKRGDLHGAIAAILRHEQLENDEAYGCSAAAIFILSSCDWEQDEDIAKSISITASVAFALAKSFAQIKAREAAY